MLNVKFIFGVFILLIQLKNIFEWGSQLSVHSIHLYALLYHKMSDLPSKDFDWKISSLLISQSPIIEITS
jgi:hypothetical protein